MNPAAGRSSWASLRRSVPALLMGLGLFLLTYQVVFNFRSGHSDYHDHLTWAMRLSGRDMLSSLYDGQEHMWHTCVHLLVMLGVGNIWKAAALVTAAANASSYFLVFKCWDRTAPEKNSRWLLAGLVLCVFLAASLTLPGYGFYGGRSAVNTWHNPTNIMVRPFAAAVFYMTVNICRRRRWRPALPGGDEGRGFSFSGGFWAEFRTPVFTGPELVLYPLCLYLSVCAKPSFLLIFAPSILIFLLIDVFRTRGRLLPWCIKLALAFLPAGILMLRQYFLFFGTISFSAPAAAVPAAAPAAARLAASAPVRVLRDAGIYFYFISPSFSGIGDFLSQLASSLIWIVYPGAFPLFILALAWRRRENTAVKLGFACMLAGLLELLCLHEGGGRAWHGNFGWGYYLATWLFWTAAIGTYAELLPEKTAAGKLARWGGTALLAWHTVCGLAYIVRIFQTAEYYW